MVEPRSLINRLEEADRLLRRGELVDARQVYVSLLPEATEEMQAQLRVRIARVDELVNPRESAIIRREVLEASEQARAEAALNEGRSDDAIAIYASIVEARPDDQLARERMTELIAQRSFGRERSSAPRIISVVDTSNAASAGAQEAGPLGAALPRTLPPPPPAEAPAHLPDVTRPTPVAVALPGVHSALGAAPLPRALFALEDAMTPGKQLATILDAPPAPLPGDPVALLEELLRRVTANRRAPSQP